VSVTRSPLDDDCGIIDAQTVAQNYFRNDSAINGNRSVACPGRRVSHPLDGLAGTISHSAADRIGSPTLIRSPLELQTRSQTTAGQTA